jgi:hypothetical protein
MADPPISDRDRTLARGCMNCPLCRRARQKQKGLAFWLVRRVEGSLCPQCRAYARVTGRAAHEPIPPDAADGLA